MGSQGRKCWRCKQHYGDERHLLSNSGQVANQAQPAATWQEAVPGNMVQEQKVLVGQRRVEG